VSGPCSVGQAHAAAPAAPPIAGTAAMYASRDADLVLVQAIAGRGAIVASVLITPQDAMHLAEDLRRAAGGDGA